MHISGGYQPQLDHLLLMVSELMRQSINVTEEEKKRGKREEGREK
jgi:hypothetical protein